MAASGGSGNSVLVGDHIVATIDLQLYRINATTLQARQGVPTPQHLSLYILLALLSVTLNFPR